MQQPGKVGEEVHKDGEYPKTKDGIIKPPSMWQMAKNFSKELAKYVAEGAPNVSQEDYEGRLDACAACPHLLKEKMRCGLCGCMLETKARWRTTTCPDNPTRWAIQDPTPKTDQEKSKTGGSKRTKKNMVKDTGWRTMVSSSAEESTRR